MDYAHCRYLASSSSASRGIWAVVRTMSSVLIFNRSIWRRNSLRKLPLSLNCVTTWFILLKSNRREWRSLESSMISRSQHNLDRTSSQRRVHRERSLLHRLHRFIEIIGTLLVGIFDNGIQLGCSQRRRCTGTHDWCIHVIEKNVFDAISIDQIVFVINR